MISRSSFLVAGLLLGLLPWPLACSGGAAMGRPRSDSSASLGDAEPGRGSVLAAAAASSTPSLPSSPPAAPKSLFDRIGGKERLSLAIDFFMTVVVQDPRVKKLVEPVAHDKERKRRVRDAIVERICAVAGGGCNDTESAREAHTDMKITQAQWSAFEEDLTAALRHQEVGDAEQHELIDALATLRKDFVQK